MSKRIYALPKSPKEAIQAGESFYFTGKPCKNGHKAKRDLRYHCVECELSHRSKPEQKKKRSEASLKWYEHNKHREDLKTTRRKRSKRWRDRHPEQKRSNHLQSKYGITLQEYELLLEKQDHKCALCKDPLGTEVSARAPLAPVVDHNHITGAVRGIVHGNCNKILGFANDDKTKLQLAIDYLIRTSA